MATAAAQARWRAKKKARAALLERVLEERAIWNTPLDGKPAPLADLLTDIALALGYEP
jgi:hypothetical protein